MSARPLEAMLQAIASGDAIARGCVNVIGFESIRRNMGERWAARRERVWEHIHRTLRATLTPADTVERIGEVEFIVFVAVESGPVAQTVCLRALQEVLTHYLGTFELADLTIKTVQGVEGSTLSCIDLDPAAVLRATDSNPAGRAGPLEDVDHKRRITAANFMREVQGYSLHFQLEDITSLRHNALAGGRIRRVVVPEGSTTALSRKELGSLDTASLAAMDVQTVDFAATLLQGDSALAYPSLVMPAALQTFGHSVSRTSYLNTLRSLQASDRRRVVVELMNVDEGTPPSRITEALVTLRAYSRGMSAFVDPTPRTMNLLMNLGLLTIMVNARQLAPVGASLEEPIARFAAIGRRVAPVTALRGLLMPSELAAARDAGITYSVNPFEARAPSALDSLRKSANA